MISMTNTNADAARTEARAKLAASRARMASFIAKHSTAKIDAEAIIDFENNIVVTGEVTELLLVKAWAMLIGIEGVVVEPADDPELGDWTCCRIPCASLEAALAKAVRS